MTKTSLVAIVLSLAAAAAFGQASAPTGAASAPEKHKLLKKLRNHKPGASATNPEASPDKKGGQ